MGSVLITGGSRGIGAECVRQFSREGCRAAFIYKSSHDAARMVAGKTGAVPICADIADPCAVRTAVADAAVVLGARIDTLVCAAGISKKGLLSEMADRDWDEIIAVNLSGSFYAARGVIPYMVRQGCGSIIFVSSMWGVSGASCEAAYSATKAALHGLTKSLAKELGPSGIRVNCVAPGVIDTDINADLTAGDRAELADETPLCRIGSASEVAKAVLYLASDGASFITGQILSVDGGFVV